LKEIHMHNIITPPAPSTPSTDDAPPAVVLDGGLHFGSADGEIAGAPFSSAADLDSEEDRPAQ
jgi:hypothetical protein